MGKFQIFQDKSGEYRWRLRAANGQIIATSGEGYRAKSDALRGIEAVKTQTTAAAVEDACTAPAPAGAGKCGCSCTA
ncbi:MAG TPA: DUF1508 domain-containing protein [Tepidisphaeraceae bacterium]|nr:DUF1508 domain-containing protein [Tepidisphaeraceae bacterium]